jgi:uncharacterized repeat protein (TIGR03847 family)
MIDVELTAPHHVTVGYTGEPGARTFYLQAQDDEVQLTLLMEKGQVEGIGELLAQLLARVEDAPATDWDRAAMELRPPIEPRWRVGEISLGVDPDIDRFVLEVAEFPVADDDEEPRPGDDEPREARIWCDRDQTRRLAAHAAEVVGQGRPRCELCGRPTDLDGGHVCPATNGHGRLSR